VSIRFCLALSLCPTLVLAASAPISKSLELSNTRNNGVFVVLHDEPSKIATPVSGMARTHAEFQRGMARKARLEKFQREHNLQGEVFWIANAIWLPQSSQAKRASLAQDSNVRAIAANPSVRAKLPVAELGPVYRDEAKAVLAATPGQTLIGAPQLWALGVRGAGVVIAGADTGYKWDHPALQASYRGWDGTAADHNYNWKDGIIASISGNGGSCGLNSQAPCDDGSHGTHTLGTMVGDDGANEQIGAAPGAKWIGCRNMDIGDGRLESYLRCMQWALAPTDLAGNNPRPELSPDVINNSWGCPPSEGCGGPEFVIMENAINSLREAGILFVAAAGNSGSSCSTVADPPAMLSATFSVGNVTLSDALASSSSRGPVTVDGSNRRKPDVSAPGSSIRSSVPPAGYGNKTGTSMASPHVAGAAALLIGAFPELRRNPSAVMQLLQQTAVPVTGLTQTCGGLPATTYPNNLVGFGRIDVFAAYQRQLSIQFANGFE
jgi:serine protease AprX